MLLLFYYCDEKYFPGIAEKGKSAIILTGFLFTLETAYIYIYMYIYIYIYFTMDKNESFQVF